MYPVTYWRLLCNSVFNRIRVQPFRVTSTEHRSAEGYGRICCKCARLPGRRKSRRQHLADSVVLSILQSSSSARRLHSRASLDCFSCSESCVSFAKSLSNGKSIIFIQDLLPRAFASACIFDMLALTNAGNVARIGGDQFMLTRRCDNLHA